MPMMYLDALEFLEEERDAWRPFEALADLTDAELAQPVAGAQGWTGRELMAHLLAWQGVALQIATELAVDETSATIARTDADWEAQRFRTQPGELRGYLTVVPEARWLKHAANLRALSDETTLHYEEHRADLDAVLAAAGR
jgi:hypothetical protein